MSSVDEPSNLLPGVFDPRLLTPPDDIQLGIVLPIPLVDVKFTADADYLCISFSRNHLIERREGQRKFDEIDFTLGSINIIRQGEEFETAHVQGSTPSLFVIIKINNPDILSSEIKASQLPKNICYTNQALIDQAFGIRHTVFSYFYDGLLLRSDKSIIQSQGINFLREMNSFLGLNRQYFLSSKERSSQKDCEEAIKYIQTRNRSPHIYLEHFIDEHRLQTNLKKLRKLIKQKIGKTPKQIHLEARYNEIMYVLMNHGVLDDYYDLGFENETDFRKFFLRCLNQGFLEQASTMSIQKFKKTIARST